MVSAIPPVRVQLLMLFCWHAMLAMDVFFFTLCSSVLVYVSCVLRRWITQSTVQIDREMAPRRAYCSSNSDIGTVFTIYIYRRLYHLCILEVETRKITSSLNFFWTYKGRHLEHLKEFTFFRCTLLFLQKVWFLSSYYITSIAYYIISSFEKKYNFGLKGNIIAFCAIRDRSPSSSLCFPFRDN